jgi:hypothetical protein
MAPNGRGGGGQRAGDEKRRVQGAKYGTKAPSDRGAKLWRDTRATRVHRFLLGMRVEELGPAFPGAKRLTIATLRCRRTATDS